MAAEGTALSTLVPRSIAIWGDEPRKITLSNEPFDPVGAWSQLYGIYILGPLHDPGWRKAFGCAGALRLSREPREGGGFLQKGRRVEQMISKTWLSTAWDAEFAGDALAAPRSWTFTSDLHFSRRPVDASFRYPDVAAAAYEERALPMESAAHSFAGRFESGAVLNEGADPLVVDSACIASNWGLFDAVQRLDPGLAEPLAFAVLQDFDLYKPGQSLRGAGSVTVEFAGGPVQLHGFRQLGRGVLPCEYWVSEQGRLVFAVQGYQGYVLNPDEPVGELLP